MYTLQSMLTGKYITELFTTEHNEMFGTRDKQEAYSFASLKETHILRNKIKCCLVVKVS